MVANPITDELLNNAFGLAYFILGDRAASIYVAIAAVDKLEAASTVQDRRQNYTPTGRSSFPAARTKVNLNEIQLLQRLVFIESELFERLLEEQQQFLHHEDLIIRYVKHLVRVTTKHNSFYVALGLCRLLYNYTTSETAEIYNVVLQDPGRMRDSHYYRSRKKRLMDQMKDRFGDLIRIEPGFGREKRFQQEGHSETLVRLIRQCLIRFTPWQSTCVLPNDLDPKRNLVRPLLFEGTDPDKEHEIEVNRIHTLTHPECLERLITVLGIDPPERRLGVPHFFISRDGPPLATDRFNPSKLSPRELKLMRHHLDKNSHHRRTLSANELFCLIDQRRVGIFESRNTPSIAFDLKEDAELLEIRSLVDEKEVPVAVWPIKYGDALSRRMTSTAVLESGQKLTFTIDPAVYDSDGPPSARITISCSVTPSEGIPVRFRGFSLWLDRLIVFARQGFLRPALAVLLIAVFGAGLWVFFQMRKSKVAPPFWTQPEARSEQEKSPPNLRPSPNQSPSSDATQHTARQLEKRAAGARRVQQSSEINETESEETRGKLLKRSSIALASVKQVFVDPQGQDQFSEQFRESLVAALQASSHFTVTTNRKEANAVFQGSVTRFTKNRLLIVRLELVDVSGQVIWSFGANGKAFLSPQDAAGKILKVLLRDVQSSRPRR